MEEKEKIKVFVDVQNGKTVCICRRSNKKCGKKRGKKREETSVSGLGGSERSRGGGWEMCPEGAAEVDERERGRSVEEGR